MTPHLLLFRAKKRSMYPQKSLGQTCWPLLQLPSRKNRKADRCDGRKQATFRSRKDRELWGYIISHNTSPCTGSTDKAIKDTEYSAPPQAPRLHWP